jgi:hypothetical protein
MTRRAHTLDTVKLLRDWEGWPAGTIASVVAEHPDTALVEVVAKPSSTTTACPLAISSTT